MNTFVELHSLGPVLVNMRNITHVIPVFTNDGYFNAGIFFTGKERVSDDLPHYSIEENIETIIEKCRAKHIQDIVILHTARGKTIVNTSNIILMEKRPTDKNYKTEIYFVGCKKLSSGMPVKETKEEIVKLMGNNE